MTEKWPVLHAGSVPHVDLATWTFRVFGEVEEEVELTWEEFNALPRSRNVQDIHCVTRWSRFDTAVRGRALARAREARRPLPSARFAVAWAEHDFTANVPLESLEDDLALLATHADGEPLTPDHGYPLRLVIPHKYFWKSAKWLRGIELLAVRPARVLGALRLQQRRRPVEGRALRLLRSGRRRPNITRSRDYQRHSIRR